MTEEKVDYITGAVNRANATVQDIRSKCPDPLFQALVDERDELRRVVARQAAKIEQLEQQLKEKVANNPCVNEED
jgi:hypothetical protein